MPQGCGMYVMDLSVAHQGTPLQAAQRAKNAGLNFVALEACWQNSADEHTPVNTLDLDDYGAAFAEAGIDVWVWGYPWGSPEQITRFVARMREAARSAKATGILLDPELGFKDERAPFMRDLLEQTIDSLDEGLGLGFSSYGLTSVHKDFPWQLAGGYGWGSPQLYTVGLPIARSAIKQWREIGWFHLIASVPTFGPNSGPNLAAYASSIAEHTEGVCFWQWRGTDKEEWRAIEAVAKRYQTVAPERRTVA
jgi:hypothetical protein